MRYLSLLLIAATLVQGVSSVKAADRAGKPKPKKRKAPVPVTGKTVPELAAFDVMMRGFMEKHEIPGAALAVVKDGRLVYARGFGYSDLKKREPVKPGALFRIASISKPVTAVAILRLVQQKKLSLDERVTDIVTLKPHTNGIGDELDKRWKTVTVRQLLHHTGGWDRSVSFDPMFRAVQFAKELKVKAPAGPNHVIRCMLGRKLDFDPGKEIRLFQLRLLPGWAVSSRRRPERLTRSSSKRTC